MSKVKKIVLEEHFSTPVLGEYATDVVSVVDPEFLKYVKPRLMDMEQMRLDDMDRNGIDMCVLSANSPGVQLEKDAALATRVAAEMNDLLGAQMQKYPTRYSGFAHLALQDPDGAAEELERCVKHLNMRGALINGTTGGDYLDHPRFSPVWERAEALGVPIYLHPGDAPTMPSNEKGYTEMAGPGWAWGAETAGHALRIIYGGVFDRFPKATLVLGHMGETLPYILWRLDSRYKMLRHTNEHPDAPVRVRPAQHHDYHLRLLLERAAPLRHRRPRLGPYHVLRRLSLRVHVRGRPLHRERAAQRSRYGKDLSRQRRAPAPALRRQLCP